MLWCKKISSSPYRDAAVVTIGDSLTSVFGGIVIFSYIGSMANTLNVSVKDVATKGSPTYCRNVVDYACSLNKHVG